MAQVTRHIEIAADPAHVWESIGGFLAIGDWHPALEGAEEEMIGSAEHRKLGLVGGGEILEKHLGEDASGPVRSYGYAIVDSPLPVSHYRAVFSAVPSGSGTTMVWSATFTPKGEGAEGVIAEIFETGLAAIKGHFG